VSEPATITIELDLGALPAEGVESFVGGATHVEKGREKVEWFRDRGPARGGWHSSYRSGGRDGRMEQRLTL
jgi:hypothetical protein